MKAVIFPARDQVKTADLHHPEPRSREVVVRVRASGLCHTDIDVMQGDYGRSAFPVVPGHEFAGEVVAVGSRVRGVKPDDRVVIDPNFECGKCRSCRRGWAHLCDNLGAYGVTEHGGFAELCAVRAEAVHPIGDMGFSLAALAEPMGCILNGLTQLQDRTIERAVIFGAGPMGHLMGLTLRAQGTGEVFMVDIDESRLRLAGENGLTPLNPGPETDDMLRRGCDLAVDATGVPAVAAALVETVANGGAALFFGACPPDARISISPHEMFRRQLSLFGSHSLNHNIPHAVSVLREIGEAATRIVTHGVPLDEIPRVILGHKPPGCLKIQAVP
ncbi:MAG: alcohol dehydrogenase catalytic domain-containing protein [Rhodobacteraceae bacterium]|nr:alcohol dehydrogenase catalytic domain-containing protein [Paracoccaceae bacterium]